MTARSLRVSSSGLAVGAKAGADVEETAGAGGGGGGGGGGGAGSSAISLGTRVKSSSSVITGSIRVWSARFLSAGADVLAAGGAADVAGSALRVEASSSSSSPKLRSRAELKRDIASLTSFFLSPCFGGICGAAPAGDGGVFGAPAPGCVGAPCDGTPIGCVFCA